MSTPPPQSDEPFAVASRAAAAQPHWSTDQWQAFEDRILIQGDTEFPPICIHSADTNDLESLQRTFRAHTPAFEWSCRALYTIAIAGAVYGFRPSNAVAILPAPFPAPHQVATGSLLLLAAVLFGSMWTARRVRLTWYVSRPYLWREAGQLLNLGLAPAMACVVVLLIRLPPSWWAAVLIPLAVLLILQRLIVHPYLLRVQSTLDRRFVVRGPSAKFTVAWGQLLAQQQHDLPPSSSDENPLT